MKKIKPNKELSGHGAYTPDLSEEDETTVKAKVDNWDLINLAGSDHDKENLNVFSESDDECKGKRIRTYSFDPENYEASPNSIEIGTG